MNALTPNQVTYQLVHVQNNGQKCKYVLALASASDSSFRHVLLMAKIMYLHRTIKNIITESKIPCLQKSKQGIGVDQC